MSELRTCPKCGKAQPADAAFNWRNGKPFGQCKACRNEYQRARGKTPEVRERQRVELAAYRQTPRGAEVHRTARRRGIEKLLLNGPTVQRASKICPGCGTEKAMNEFNEDRYKPDGHRGYCKPCEADRRRDYVARNRERVRAAARARRLRILYGLTPEDFDAMLAAQGARCAICPATEPGGSGTWAVDHCHETGRVRGILCHRCNRAIGRLGDDPARLRDAAAYLLRHRC